MISNCGHDENNKYKGGKAGDQTGGEWALINWYNRPWKCVLRHPDTKPRMLSFKGLLLCSFFLTACVRGGNRRAEKFL